MRSYALDAGDSLVLFDPLVSSSDLDVLADGRPVVVILTCHWHRRSSRELREQLGATVHAPAESVAELGFPALPYKHGEDLPRAGRAASADARDPVAGGAHDALRTALA